MINISMWLVILYLCELFGSIVFISATMFMYPYIFWKMFLDSINTLGILQICSFNIRSKTINIILIDI